MTEAIESNDLPGYYDQLMNQLGDLVNLVRGNLSAICRAVMSALIVVEVRLNHVTWTNSVTYSVRLSASFDLF